MPPKPCPRRLQRLIDNEPHVLRPIIHALQDRRQNKGPQTYAAESVCQVTINLTDHSVTVRNELHLALNEIEPPSSINLIRECPICNAVFWAGRQDKKACNKHAEQWRKGKQRRKARVDAAKHAAERQDAQLKKALQNLSRTADALVNAIVIEGYRKFYEIDNEACAELKENSSVLRVPSRRIVRRTLTMLVDRGYLTHHPHRNEPHLDLYVAEQKLIKAWKELAAH